MISEGEIVAEGTPRDLKALVTEGTVVEIETFDAPGDAAERLRRLPGVMSVSVEDREQAQVLVVQSQESDGTTTQQLLIALGDVQVGRVSAREPTLEDAYVSLVTKE